MNDAPVRIVVDGARKRRKYLLARAAVGAMGCSGVGIVIGFGFLTLVCALSIPFVLVLLQLCGPAVLVLCIASTAVNGALTLLGIRAVREANQRAAEMSYIPPIREQIAALPDEGILLRGSDQPAAVPEELLRPADSGSHTADENLLRAIDGGVT